LLEATMGLLWEMAQQGQQRRTAASLDQRVDELEERLEAQTRLLSTLVQKLEQRFGEDLDEDQRIG
jgi:phosphopantetheine adenylyltransferase